MEIVAAFIGDHEGDDLGMAVRSSPWVISDTDHDVSLGGGSISASPKAKTTSTPVANSQIAQCRLLRYVRVRHERVAETSVATPTKSAGRDDRPGAAARRGCER